ncbi:Ig-like domain-containing protein [Capilliphycus salinus ALCB114379]|uniref:Ig-like domain-containing protein n=1 Tax=Capilliphycus salinus TaxID=2768948 RepID=UPI0039A5114E
MNPTKTEILVVIDGQVEETEKLLEGVVTGTKAIVIDPNKDGVEQITKAITENSNISEIQIISHGSPGCLQLGNSELSLETLNRYANSLQTWSVSSLLLYGCNVAAGDAGVEFIEKLGKITGAKIAASANKIGYSALGGDWNLEVKTEEFEVSLALTSDAIANYNFTFPRPIEIKLSDNDQGDNGNTIANPASPETIVAPDGNGRTVTYNFGLGKNTEIDSFLDPRDNQEYTFVERGIQEFKLRRDDNQQAKGNREIIWYQKADGSNNTTINLAPDIALASGDQDPMEVALFDDLINRGTDNIFTNNGNRQLNNNNIERVDYINRDGLPVPQADLDGIGFVIMERGGNDQVQIAAITALDENGNPSEFGELITVQNNDWGKSEIEYNIAVLRRDPGENEIALTTPERQVIAGIFVSYEDLLGENSVGDKFFGYALFPTDIDPQRAKEDPNYLVNWREFPDDTQENDGGLDLVGGGFLYQRTNLNFRPVAVDDTATTPVNTSVPIAVLSNDSDANFEDVISIVENSITTPANGTVSIGENGSIIYTPNQGFTGEDTFEYTITDGQDTDTATVTVTVEPPENTNPDAVDDTLITGFNTPVTINVLGNDTDPENDPLSITTFEQNSANGGTVARSENGQLIYTPAANFTGTDTFEYTITDGQDTDTATVTVTVDTRPNTNPDAVDDTLITGFNTPVTINVLGNDTDPENDPLTITTFEQNSANGGTVARSENGQLIYTPAANFTGTDTFEYTITDGQDTDTATVTVTVDTRPNTNPDAVDDTLITGFNTPVTINVLGNDTDPENDPLTITTFEQNSANGGTVARSENGQLIYTPAANFTGTDTFEYTINDGNEGTDTATVTVTVDTRPNTNPDAVDDTLITGFNTPVTINVLGNDTDPENDPLSITTFDQNSANGGTVARSENGQLIYTPAANFTGTDTFEYTINDGNGGTDTATVTVTVDTRPNTNPDAVDDTLITGFNTPVTINVLGNDTDPENDPLSITTFDQNSANGGTVARSENGQLIYTPAENFTGTDTFTYTVNDGNGGTDTATVTVTVDTRPNTNPDAVDDTLITGFNTPVTINVLGNDTDPENDPLNITTFDQNSANGGTVARSENGQLIYTPAENFTGTDTFTYTINDGNGGTDTATVTVTVDTRPNTNPDAVDDTLITGFNTPVTINVLGNDTDPENDPLSITTFDQNSANGGTVARSENGQLIYTPAENFTGTDTFTYTINDGNGGTDTATVTVTVEPPANTNPDAVDDERSIRSNTAIIINVVGNDSDPENDPLNITTFDQNSANGGTITRSASGRALVYTPAANFTGTDSFIYTVDDGKGGTDTATVTINVESDQTLLAANDTATTDQNTNVTINVLANDIDPENDPLEINTFDENSANGGTISRSENGEALVYTPAPGFSGTDTFTYEATDGTNTDIATVTVTVNPATNTEPSAIDDQRRTEVNTAVTVNVLTNDTDPENDPLTIENFDATSANGGIIEPSEEGQALVYTPPQEFVGTDTFTYTINDGQGGTDTATVTINVTDSQLKPEAVDDRATTQQNTEVSINVVANDIDPENDPLNINSFDQTSANGGTVAASEDGQSLVYTPASGFIGVDTFVYQITDGTNTDIATVTVSVEAADGEENQPPTATDENVNTPFQTPVTFNLSDNVSDPDGNIDLSTIDFDPATPEINRQLTLSQGTLTVNNQGQVTFTPVGGFTGVVNIPYTVADDLGETSQPANISITVNPDSNQPPTAENVENTSILNNSAPIPLPLSAANFGDSDGTVERINFTLPDPGQGTLLLDGVAVTDPVRVQRLTPDQLDNLSFRPNSQFVGNVTFTYTVTDDDGANSNAANITIPVSAFTVPTVPPTPSIPSIPSELFEPPANLPPVVEDQSKTVPNDGNRFPVPPLKGNDRDGNIKHYTITELPPNGTLFLNDEEITSLERVRRLTPSQAEQLSFKPNPNFTGEIRFSYTATDDDDTVSNVGIVRLTVEDDGSVPRGEPIDDGGCDCPPLPEFGTVALPERLNLTPSAFNAFDNVIDGSDNADDILAGSLGSDVLFTLGGDDRIEAFDGDDTMYGGVGNDLQFGNQGNDFILGGDGRDTLIGTEGNNGFEASANIEDDDTLHGHGNDDLMQGGPGADLIYSGKQDDFAFGGKNDDMIFGDQGNDTLHGDQGNDTLVGDTVDESEIESERGLSGMIDLVWGGAGDDFINGGRSNDTLSGGVGNDTVRGGKEDDLVYGEAGNDLMYGDFGNDKLCGNEGNDTVYGDINDSETLSTVPGRDSICGGSGNDILFGNEDQDRLCGGTDNDTLYGGLAEDTLAGEQGDDWLFGDQGDDLISGGSGSDRFILFSGSGTDTIQDFQVGTDLIALGGGLSFDALTLSQTGTSTVISLDGQQLAILNDIQATAITSDSFTAFVG